MKIDSILIVEDNPSTIEWLRACADEAFSPKTIVLATTVTQAMKQVNDTLDLAIIDLHLPDGEGVEIIQAINQTSDHTASVVATIFDDDEHIFPALQAGAAGYLLKDLTKEDFITALSGIVEGKPPLSPAIARKVLSHFSKIQQEKTPQIQITPREKEVLQCLGKGLQIKRIAQELLLSPYTISDHVKNIYRKLNISSKSEAAVEAVKRGLV